MCLHFKYISYNKFISFSFLCKFGCVCVCNKLDLKLYIGTVQLLIQVNPFIQGYLGEQAIHEIAYDQRQFGT